MLRFVLLVSSDEAVDVRLESSVDCVVDATVVSTLVSVAPVLDTGALVATPLTDVSMRTAVTLLALLSLPHAERPPNAVTRMVAASVLITMCPPILNRTATPWPRRPNGEEQSHSRARHRHSNRVGNP